MASLATSSSHLILDAIYAAIESGDYQKAKELCLKKEIVRFPLAKALLSYCYAMLKDFQRALDIARSVTETTGQMDDVLLNTLSYAFKRCRAEKDMSECFEKAMNSRPISKELMYELFTCYAKMNEPKKMHQTAQKLYKSTDEPQFLFWSVACLLHQNDLPPTMTMVAQKTAQKIIYELQPQRRPGGEELGLYLYLILKSGNTELALASLNELNSRKGDEKYLDQDDFVKNPNRVAMHGLNQDMMYIDILLRLQRWHELIPRSKEVLQRYPDQWNVHKMIVAVLLAFLEGAINILPSSTHPPDKFENATFPDYRLQINPAKVLISDLTKVAITMGVGVNDTVDDVQRAVAVLFDHINYLMNLHGTNSKIRGPLLAVIDIFTEVLAKVTVAMRMCIAAPETTSDQCKCIHSFVMQWLRCYHASPLNAFLIQHRSKPSIAVHFKSVDTPSVVYDEPLSESLCHQFVAWMGNETALLLSYYLETFSEKQTCFADIQRYIFSLSSCRMTTSTPTTHSEDGAVRGLIGFAGQQKEKIRNQIRNSMKESSQHSSFQKVIDQQSNEELCRAIANSVSIVEDSIVEVSQESSQMPSQILDKADDEDEMDGEDSQSKSQPSVAANTNPSQDKKTKKKKKKKVGIDPLSSSSKVGNEISESVETKATVPSQSHQQVDGKRSKKTKKNKDMKGPTSASNAAVTELYPLPDASEVISSQYSAVLVTLCSYAKFDQVDEYCRCIQSEPFNPSSQLQNRMRLELYEATKAVTMSGAGGQRDVQPGDELLLQVSSLYRTNLFRYQDGSIRLPILSSFITAIQWASRLLNGIDSSPFCYGFKLDVLDPFRCLGVAEPAIVAFNGLGVKHIQVDSMSYLIIPTLIETGFLNEAIKQHRVVCQFHQVAKRETLEMIAQTFKFANYSKGLELRQFISKCERSIQLELSKSELPLLEIVNRFDRYSEAADYLKDVITVDKLPESHSFVNKWDPSQWSDNSDYHLLVRTDVVSEEWETSQNAVRKFQMAERIHFAQRMVRLVYSVLMDDVDTAQELLTQSVAASSNCIHPSTEVSSISVNQWSQHIDGGLRRLSWHAKRDESLVVSMDGMTSCSHLGQPDRHFVVLLEQSMYRSIALILLVNEHSIGCLHRSQSTDIAPSDDSATLGLLMTTLLEAIRAVLQVVDSTLFGRINEAGIIVDWPLPFRLPSMPSSPGLAPIHPVWIKRVSSFVQSMGSIVPLLLQRSLSLTNRLDSVQLDMFPDVDYEVQCDWSIPSRDGQLNLTDCIQSINLLVQTKKGCLPVVLKESIRIYRAILRDVLKTFQSCLQNEINQMETSSASTEKTIRADEWSERKLPDQSDDIDDEEERLFTEGLPSNNLPSSSTTSRRVSNMLNYLQESQLSIGGDGEIASVEHGLDLPGVTKVCELFCSSQCLSITRNLDLINRKLDAMQ